ncbi:MAG: NAD(P)-binding domain-containing protein [Dehalococcoidia bacterium]|nr:NAD(P)-binding domain-containing protein [Dehalococcoidia bacterium]MDP7262426.1 NAD(P)-binding domain-containing protein [Dehalococcoidia bacterium]MDP7485513.1 NAD(P)-binding domain-containing protein [Dehalococcoidia bacterium]
MSGSHENESHNIVIIGAGSAGLATSYFLKEHGIEHVILERGEVGNTWDVERWDGFYLVNPNWAVRLPGFHYVGDDPEGYLSKIETINYLQNYAKHFDAPVRTGVEVDSLERKGDGYLLTLDSGQVIAARCVVVATGAFGVPKVPDFSPDITDSVIQIHSADYKNPQALVEGAVLVVGSGQSGAQVAEELHDAGRQVFLSVGNAGRRPRRYRGRDSSWWNYTMGNFDRTIENVESVNDARYGSSAHTSGARGGHNIYLRQMAKDGVTLVGPVTGGRGDTLNLRTDLLEILRAIDEYPIRWKANVDAYIEKHGMQMPPDDTIDPPGIQEWPKEESPASLNLLDAGIITIIWSTGFKYEFDWIKLPITGEHNYPNQTRGVTEYPGLYFMGLQWMFGSKSAQFIGVGEDAEYVTGHIAEKFGRA